MYCESKQMQAARTPNTTRTVSLALIPESSAVDWTELAFRAVACLPPFDQKGERPVQQVARLLLAA